MMVNLGEDHVKQYIALEALITKKYMHYSIRLGNINCQACICRQNVVSRSRISTCLPLASKSDDRI